MCFPPYGVDKATVLTVGEACLRGGTLPTQLTNRLSQDFFSKKAVSNKREQGDTKGGEADSARWVTTSAPLLVAAGGRARGPVYVKDASYA